MHYNAGQSNSRPQMTILCPGDFIVVGETQEAKRFQPSDWAERLAGSLSTLRNRRVVYSPLLIPIVYEGIRCLRVAAELENEYPAIYKEVIQFTQCNHLKVVCDVPV